MTSGCSSLALIQGSDVFSLATIDGFVYYH
jgi:hypothetical protein